MSSNSIDIKKIRQFGLVGLIFFGCLSGIALYTAKPILACFFALLALIGAGFVVVPKLLSPVYAGWIKVSTWLGKAVTVIILVLTYFLVITPYAIIMRLLGGYTLPVKPDRTISSYWVHRTEPAQQKEQFLKRF
jgi:hypothetical protein